MDQEFCFVMNQTGRDNLRDALSDCLRADFNPEIFADELANNATVCVIGGEPEASFEISARHNIHGIPWTITIAGPDFFNAEPLDME